MATNVLELRRFERPATPLREVREPVLPIAAREDILPAALHLAREAQRLGLRMMVWHDLATLEAMTDADGNPVNTSAFGWPEAALEAWHDLDKALRSPLLRAARVASEPVAIARHAIRSLAANRLLDQIDLAELDHCPLGAPAIVVPVHMALGQVGAAFLVPLTPGESDLAAELDLCAGGFAERIRRFVTACAGISRDARYLPANGLLSAREIECLSWVAHGKTDFEISIILGCSHAGVRYHVTRACAKLGAVNRAQSVFRAAQLGYLGVPAAPGSRSN